MIYFVVSDIHGYYSILKNELDKNNFDMNNPEHKLIIVGDAFDRGREAKILLEFLLKLKENNKLIYVKGNHESLMEDLISQLNNKSIIDYQHYSNGTVATLCQICDINEYDIMLGMYDIENINNKMSNYIKLTDNLPYYYELDDYIFTHGFIPLDKSTKEIKYNEN